MIVNRVSASAAVLMLTLGTVSHLAAPQGGRAQPEAGGTSFSGLRQGDPKYEALVSRVVDVVQKRGSLILGGPSAWKDTRKGYNFFQGPDELSLLRAGARAALGGQPAAGQPKGVAPIEGAER